MSLHDIHILLTEYLLYFIYTAPSLYSAVTKARKNENFDRVSSFTEYPEAFTTYRALSRYIYWMKRKQR